MDEAGVIFDLQRFSVHDGPGIRSLVFFKGCPLRCRWCANPESHRFEPELLFDPATCIACGQCRDACPAGAIREAPGGLRYERERCRGCGACVATCYAEARTLAGRRVTAEALVAEALKDAPFFANSGGGLTLGGGEPLAQPAFAAAILQRARAAGVHAAVETCGHVPWSRLEQIRPWTDLFLYDVKHLDPTRHRAETGGELSLILSNLAALASSAVRVVVRTPVIPGFNDDEHTIRAVARSVADLGLQELHLLPYHRLGQGKYRLLGRPYDFHGGDGIAESSLETLAAAARRTGLTVQIGG